LPAASSAWRRATASAAAALARQPLGSALPRAHYDVIFARWVFLFLPDPRAHVRQLAAALARAACSPSRTISARRSA
jgi:hypothetical protein